MFSILINEIDKKVSNVVRYNLDLVKMRVHVGDYM